MFEREPLRTVVSSISPVEALPLLSIIGFTIDWFPVYIPGGQYPTPATSFHELLKFPFVELPPPMDKVVVVFSSSYRRFIESFLSLPIPQLSSIIATLLFPFSIILGGFGKYLTASSTAWITISFFPYTMLLAPCSSCLLISLRHTPSGLNGPPAGALPKAGV
jgi:hypothetical protein